MATLEETEDAHNSAGETEKPKSQSSARSRTTTKKVVEESEPSEDGNGKEERNNEDGEEDEEEYEIEAIIDSRRDMFKKHEMAFLVKWKGYGPEHNSWVTEGDAENARDLINEFLKARAKAKEQSHRPSARGRKPNSVKSAKATKAGTPESESASARVSTTKRGRVKAASPSEDEEEEAPRKLKKSRANASANGSASAKRSTLASLNKTDDDDVSMADANGMVEDEREWTTMKDLKMGTLKSWEDLVKEISTVESHKNGLMIYFQTTDGKYVREPSSICAKKFPQKLIQFYESHLRWRAADEGDDVLSLQ